MESRAKLAAIKSEKRSGKRRKYRLEDRLGRGVNIYISVFECMRACYAGREGLIRGLCPLTFRGF